MALFEIAEHFWTWPVSLSDAGNYQILPTLSYFPSMFITCCRLTKNNCSMVWNHHAGSASWGILVHPWFPCCLMSKLVANPQFSDTPKIILYCCIYIPIVAPLHPHHILVKSIPLPVQSIVGCILLIFVGSKPPTFRQTPQPFGVMFSLYHIILYIYISLLLPIKYNRL